jgi:hypothetical protein
MGGNKPVNSIQLRPIDIFKNARFLEALPSAAFACLSQFMLYLLGLAVKAADKHRQYQANSIKKRNVLSNQFIGLRAYKDKSLRLLKSHWRAEIKTLQDLIKDPQACY